MTTFIIILLLILVVTGGQSSRTQAPRPTRRSWGQQLNDQARDRLDHSNPVANDIRRGWDNQH